MKKIIKFLLIFIILILIFMASLKLTCLFSSSVIKRNVESSSKTLLEEGNRKICFIFYKFQFKELDNYSDALMINTAYSIDNKTPMYSAFTAKKNYVPGVTERVKQDVVGELSSSSKYEEHNEVSELKDTVNGISTESFEYAKYWHGYLIFLRPLLIFMDYSKIRILLTLILAVLSIFVTTFIAENKNKTIAAFYFISLIFIEYFYIGLNLMNSITFLIMMIASLVLVKRFEKIKDFPMFFFIIGMCVGFFCLLDTPLLTLLGPVSLYFVFKDEKGKDDIKDLIKYSLFWGIGYALTWVAKWVLMDLLYDRSLVMTGLGQVLYRSVGGTNVLQPILAICLNLLSMAIPLMIVVLIIDYYFIMYHDNITKEKRKKYRIFLIIGVIPLIWYIVLSNHSAYHFFFTYRLLGITMFAYLMWGYCISKLRST